MQQQRRRRPPALPFLHRFPAVLFVFNRLEHAAVIPDKEERDNEDSTPRPQLQQQALPTVYSAHIAPAPVESWRWEPVFTVSVAPSQRPLPADRDTS